MGREGRQTALGVSNVFGLYRSGSNDAPAFSHIVAAGAFISECKLSRSPGRSYNRLSLAVPHCCIAGRCPPLGRMYQFPFAGRQTTGSVFPSASKSPAIGTFPATLQGWTITC
jgi:hypothetical protein